ncbi:branched-chain amino acid ABC transporter permease, partial [Pseudomonas syringae pv. tagetis]
MLYRETGQLASSYSDERRVFLLRQDRIGLWGMLAFAFIAVPLLGNAYCFSAILSPFLVRSLAGLGLNLLTGYAGK